MSPIGTSIARLVHAGGSRRSVVGGRWTRVGCALQDGRRTQGRQRAPLVLMDGTATKAIPSVGCAQRAPISGRPSAANRALWGTTRTEAVRRHAKRASWEVRLRRALLRAPLVHQVPLEASSAVKPVQLDSTREARAKRFALRVPWATSLPLPTHPLVRPVLWGRVGAPRQ